MAELNTFSPIAGDHTAAPPEGAPEGWTGAQVNDVVRELMAKLYRWYQQPEFIEITYRMPAAGTKTFTRISDVQFQINNCDARNNSSGGPGFNIANRRVRLQSGSTIWDGFIISATFSSPHTTVNVLMDGAFIPATIDSVRVQGLTTLSRVAFSNLLVNLDDDSANNAAQDLQTATGSYTTRSLPTDLAGELRRLRYAIARATVGIGTLRNSSTEGVGWIEQPARSTENKLLGGRFAIWDGAATANSIYGWTKLGITTTYETTQRVTADGAGREFHCVASATGQGVSQLVQGLRASTLYLVRARVRRVSGSFVVETISGSGAIYGNMARTISSGTTDVEVSDVILTDATPTQITVRVRSTAAAEFFCSEVDLIPLTDLPRANQDAPRYRAQKVVSVEAAVTAGSWTAVAGLESDTIHTPGPGTQIYVSATVVGECQVSSNRGCGVRIEESQNGGAYAAVRTGAMWSNDTDHPSTAALQFLREANVGTTYRYRIAVYPITSNWNVQPSLTGPGQTDSTLQIEVDHVAA